MSTETAPPADDEVEYLPPDDDPAEAPEPAHPGPPADAPRPPHPPHTPRQQREGRTGAPPEVLGHGARRAVVVVAPLVRGAGAGAWWAAEQVWKRPALWAAVAATVVWTTRVTLSHLAACVLVGAVLAFGTNGGATNRRERFVRLLAVGHYRKWRRRIRKRWVPMWANAGLVRAALTPGAERRLPKLKACVPHRDGVTAYVHGEPVAVGTTEVVSHARELAETVGAKSLRVTKPEQGRDRLHRRSDLLAITFKFNDPFPPRPIHPSELPAPSEAGRVVIGLDEEHRGLEKSLFLPSLIVGAPGSGKSTEVWTTLRALRMAGIPFHLRVFDPKGGLELGDLADAAFRYESLPSRWPYFLQAACEALKIRQEIMRKMSTNHGRRVRKIAEPSEEFPLDLMLIDELVTVLAFSRGQDAKVRVWGNEMSAKEAFTVYLSQIRASLGSCIALSQLGEKQILGPARGMFPYISCLRVGPTEKELVDILLGQGAHNAYPAHELDPSDPNMAGRGWVRTKEGVIAYRAAFMNDAERAQEAREIAKATARSRARGHRDPEVMETAKRAPRNRRTGERQGAREEQSVKVTDRRSVAREAAREAAKSDPQTPGGQSSGGRSSGRGRTHG